MISYKKRGFSNFSKPHKIITGFFLLIFIASVIFIVVPMNGGAGFGIGTWFPSVYFLLLFAATYNLNNLKKILRKFYKPLIFIFYFGMTAFFIIFIIFCALILGYSPDDIPENPDLIIVLGCQVYGYTPGNLLRYRLETSIQTLDKYPEALCIVSGGQGPDETVPEALTMKKYLSDNKIDADRIYEEPKSSSTFENLLFSKEIISENSIKSENIIIITSEYHIPRAIMIAGRIFDNARIYAVKSKTPFALFSAGITREFFAFVKSFIFDWA